MTRTDISDLEICELLDRARRTADDIERVLATSHDLVRESRDLIERVAGAARKPWLVRAGAAPI